jgi:BirA family biotin operon repressor/biotin-[acetyl-CoA-carboxylase] ligase
MRTAQAFEFDTVDSTNEVAKRLIQEGRFRDPGYVVARCQTAGKGSRGRVWLSPRDAGIYLSVVAFSPTALGAALQTFTLAAGIACVETLNAATGLAVCLKPINDLYVGLRKLGGILTEAVIEQNQVRALVTGVGINLRKADRLLPAGSPEAICLQELLSPHLFSHINVQNMIADLVERILFWNSVVWTGDNERVRREWDRYAITEVIHPVH